MHQAQGFEHETQTAGGQTTTSSARNEQSRESRAEQSRAVFRKTENMVWPTKDVGDISDMLQMKTSSWLSQCMTTMAGLFITIAANVQDVASEMRHIHIGSTSDEEEEEDEEEEKEAMEKEPHLIQMRLALADISSDPAELCALPRMISLTAQGIAEAVKGRQNQRTEELQRKMRSLAFKKMRWKLDKGRNQNSQHQHQTGSCGQRCISNTSQSFQSREHC